ncbi:MAG: malate dehydrogenase (quinone) [Blastochloris sp.]|nr:malate dehydrogenase (quinone) [Blastochloris sp.]
MNHNTHVENPDVILIGSGVMSANLGVLLKSLDPALRIQVYEVTSELAQESSHGWNNAGTGHAGICELSYTPHAEADGTVKVDKVIQIFEQFEQSKQFWSHAVRSGKIAQPRDFINPVSHLSFVHGQKQVDFLKARHAGMSAHHFFKEMEYSTDRATIGAWAPLLTEGRGEVPIAATKMDGGTDVNFGELSRKLLHWLSQQEGCGIASSHRVVDLNRTGSGWELVILNSETGERRRNRAGFVFVGAGGGSLPLLQKAGIPESKGMGGFPIGGQWLVCDKPEIVQRHQAKVYGQALDAAPTMAVPHLDTRVLDGRKTLLFGPFAAWTTKFLHRKGSYLDLPCSVKPDNILTLIKIGLSNLELVRYLIQQGTQSMADRMEVLHVFYPAARAEDWKLIDAGIRVQAIKKTDGEAGIVHYGTEVITSADGSISALLGASPGASVSVNIVLEVVQRCFPSLLARSECQARLDEMIPGWNTDFKRPENARRFQEIQSGVNAALQLS